MAVTLRTTGQVNLLRIIQGQYSTSQILEARLRAGQQAPRLDIGQVSTVAAPQVQPVAPAIVAARVVDQTISGGAPQPVRVIPEVPPPAPAPGRPVVPAPPPDRDPRSPHPGGRLD